MPGDNPDELWDNNELGQVSFKKFYVGKGMEALQNMIRKSPEALVMSPLEVKEVTSLQYKSF